MQFGEVAIFLSREPLVYHWKMQCVLGIVGIHLYLAFVIYILRKKCSILLDVLWNLKQLF